MITKVTLKKPMHFGDQRIANIESSKGFAITIQAGCIVVRHPNGECRTRALSEIIECEGSPAAPPSLKGKAE